MAEQDTDIPQQQHIAEEEDKTQSTSLPNVSPSGDYKQTNTALNVKQKEDLSSSSEFTNSKAKNGNGENMKQAGVTISEEETSTSATPHDQVDRPKTRLKVSPATNTETGGDNERGQEHLLPPEDANIQEKTLRALSEEIFGGGDGDKRIDNVDTIGPTSKETTEPIAPEVTEILADSASPSASTNSEATNSSSANIEQADIKNNERGQEHALLPGDANIQEEIPYSQRALSGEILGGEDGDKGIDNVDTIGPTSKETTEPIVPEITGILTDSASSSASTNSEAKNRSSENMEQADIKRRSLIITVSIVAVVAAILVQYLQPESPPQRNDVRQIDIFLRQMEKVKTQFPGQRAELWNRSRIHLKRHLQTLQPTEPVSLILTAGLRAERTLYCLAQSLASAFSSALNASVLHIDGASKASQESDQVKLDIDSKLQGAFEGDKPVAVIHRFEELPPGSTLIFYRYCDHENAAYKKTFLIFTVLLGDEEEIPAKINLSAVEEMVDDHLQKKFLSHGHPVAFDMMDRDKYGGLWSRISHLILPVASEERTEREGCKET